MEGMVLNSTKIGFWEFRCSPMVLCMNRSEQISILIAEMKKSVGFLFWFRFRAYDGTVKTFKDGFIPFREMHHLCFTRLLCSTSLPFGFKFV